VKGAKYLEFSKENGFVLDPLGPADLTKELDQWMAIYQMLIRELKIDVKK
jgi:hypothetical protein